MAVNTLKIITYGQIAFSIKVSLKSTKRKQKIGTRGVIKNCVYVIQ